MVTSWVARGARFRMRFAAINRGDGSVIHATSARSKVMRMNREARNMSAYAALAAPRRVPRVLRGVAWATAIAIPALSCTPIAGQPVQTTVTSTAAATFSVPATFAVDSRSAAFGLRGFEGSLRSISPISSRQGNRRW